MYHGTIFSVRKTAQKNNTKKVSITFKKVLTSDSN